MRLFLTLLIFLFNSFFAMTDKQTVENCYQKCKDELQLVDFVPTPFQFKLLMMHGEGRDLIKKIAQQDFLWQGKKDLLGWSLARPTLIRLIIGLECKDSQTATILNIFLTTAKEKGYFKFINSKHFIMSILKHAIESNNVDCTKVALAHDDNGSLDIRCFSMTNGDKYRPLEFACKEFGSESKMVDVLLSHSATSKSAAYDLFGPLKRII